jgi:hypothetical protein
LGEIGVHWGDNIKEDLKEIRSEGVWTGINWLRTGTSGVFFLTR